MRGAENASFTFDRLFIRIGSRVVPINDVNRFVYGSFTKSVTNHNYIAPVDKGEVAESQCIFPPQLSRDIFDSIYTKKITLSDVSGSVAVFRTGKTGTIGKVQVIGIVEADADFSLGIQLSLTDNASSGNKSASFRLKGGMKKAVYWETDFEGATASNLSLFFQMQKSAGGNFTFDKFYLKIGDEIIPVSDVVRFVVGSFTKVVTDDPYNGVLDKGDLPAGNIQPVIDPYRLDDSLFVAQNLYKITLSNTMDAITEFSSGYSADSLGKFKVCGLITSSVTRRINIVASPKTDGTDSVNQLIDVEAGKPLWVDVDFDLSSAAVTNLSIFFQLRNAAGDTFVFDRFYIKIGDAIIPVTTLNRFVVGSFTKSTEAHDYRGCVSRAEISGLNKLFGKKILVFGDSISDTYSTNRYPTYVASLTGATQINYAVSSAGYAKNALYPHSKWGQVDTKVYNMIEKAHNAGETCDLVIMAAGTNDWDFSAPLGQLSDIEQETMANPSFYWCVGKAIKNLIEYYPLASYLVIVPLPRNQPSGSGNQHTVKTSTGKTLVDYCQAIKDVCYWYSIPYLDMMNDSNLHLESPTAKTQWMPDGLHPSDAYAFQKFAPMVISRFSEIL